MQVGDDVEYFFDVLIDVVFDFFWSSVWIFGVYGECWIVYFWYQGDWQVIVGQEVEDDGCYEYYEYGDWLVGDEV